MKPPNTERSITRMVPTVVATTKSRKMAAIARNIDIHERCKANKIKNWRMNLKEVANMFLFLEENSLEQKLVSFVCIHH